MLRLCSTLLLLLFFSLVNIFCQAPLPMTFGKVPNQNLEMKVYEPDSTAEAVVLCEYGEAKVKMFADGAKLRSKFHRRIKILKRSAFDYGDVSIPFYSYKNKEEFYFDKAMVHLPDGSKIKLHKDDVFIEEINKYYSAAKFSFPQMEEGCIIEYSYYLNAESIYELVDWFFQEEIPVRYSEVRVEFPNKNFSYSYLFQGNEGMVKQEEKENGEVTFSGKNGTMILGERRFIMKDAPALQEESYITTMDDYRARIRFQLAEIRYPDGRIVQVMNTWENMKKDLDHHAYFGEQYQRKSPAKKMVAELKPLAVGLGSQAEIARVYYDYFVEKMDWNGYYSLSTRPEKLDELFTRKNCNSAEINLMLLVMLRDAGIPAFPLVTSTRSNGKMYEDYPIIDQFNHTMVYAQLDGTPTILDATNRLCPPGYPSISALNRRGILIEDKGAPTWMDIVPPKNGTDVFSFNLTLKEDGSLEGMATGAYKGYNAAPERREYYRDKSGEHWEERFSERYSTVEIDAVRTGNLEKIDNSFYDTLNLNIAEAAQVAGDFMYLSPVIFSQFLENPFKQPERLYPVDIPYPFSEHYVLKLELPDGYAVEELPESAHFTLPDKGGTYYFSVEEKQKGIVIVTARLHLRRLIYMPLEYPSIKELFDLVVEKCGEQIVLKKI